MKTLYWNWRIWLSDVIGAMVPSHLHHLLFHREANTHRELSALIVSEPALPDWTHLSALPFSEFRCLSAPFWGRFGEGKHFGSLSSTCCFFKAYFKTFCALHPSGALVSETFSPSNQKPRESLSKEWVNIPETFLFFSQQVCPSLQITFL